MYAKRKSLVTAGLALQKMGVTLASSGITATMFLDCPSSDLKTFPRLSSTSVSVPTGLMEQTVRLFQSSLI